MGFSGIGIGSLVLILLIILVLFGTKRLRNMGEDIGSALRGFRKGLQESEDDTKDKEKPDPDKHS